MTTLREAQQRILNDELPASEAAILLNDVLDCPHMDRDGGCGLVEVCRTDPVIDPFLSEVNNEPF